MATKLPIGRPKTGSTPERQFRISDEDYERAKHAAKLEYGGNVSELIRTGVENETTRVLELHKDKQ